MKVGVNGLSFNVSPNSTYFPFWQRVSAGYWEPSTFAIFDRFLRKDRSYFDVGAWIGPTVLYGVQKAKLVYAFEPDPIAFSELKRNVELNPNFQENVYIYNQCIASESGCVELYAGGLYASGNSAFGDSMSSLMSCPPEYGQACIQVEAITLEEFVNSNEIRDCNFIKMDIEGSEYIVLSSIQKYLSIFQPTLYISFHDPLIDLREESLRNSFEILSSVYPYIYSIDGELLALTTLIDSVKDWTDDAPGSLCTRLYRTIGDGVVATHEEW